MMENAVFLAVEPVALQRATPRDAPAGLTVEVAATVEALDRLRPDWTRLERLAGPKGVFQSFAQIRIWARHFAGKRQRLHVAVARDNGQVVLILPLVIGGPPGLKTARIAGDPIAQYSDVLADPAADLCAAFAAALKSVRQAGAQAIIFRRLRSDSAILDLAAGGLRPGSAAGAAPFADLSRYATFEAYLASLSKNMRKGLRNRKHHLEKVGGVAFELFGGGPEARSMLADAIDLKRTWLIQRGAVSSAFLDPNTKDCLLALAGDPASGAVVMRLSIAGVPAAIRFGFEYSGVYFAYMAAYDKDYANLSPGKMLMEYYMSRAWERGVARVDMLPPMDRHKTDWCAGETAVMDYTLPLTLSGRLYARYYQERMRPGMRKAWYLMPTPLRSLLASLMVTI